MSTPGVPPWGCPWHGLVRNGTLTLPNGETMQYPQPGGQTFQSGVSRIVAHPDAPDDERTEEQRAADDELGREWRKTALLAGGRLYGKFLGDTGWIYIDPNGDRWRCSISPAYSTDVPITVTLHRFGVLGGAEKSHSYTVGIPEFQQDSPPLNLFGLDVWLCDSKTDGSAALFVIAGKFRLVADVTFPFSPLGWYEVRLSGPGADCTASVHIVRSREQALGARISELVQQPGAYFPHGPVWDPIYGYEPSNERSVILYGSIATDPIDARRRNAVLGRVLAMFYSPTGVLRELTIDCDSLAESEFTAQRMNFLADSFDGEISTRATHRLTARLKLDGEVVESREYSEVYSYPQIFTSVPGRAYTRGNNAWIRTSSWERAYAGGGVKVGVDTVSDNWGGYSTRSARLDTVVNSTDDGAARIGPEPIFMPWGELETTLIQPAMHSLHVYSLAAWLSRSPRSFGGQCATPGGVKSAPSMTVASELDTAYGAWCPVTDQLVRDTVPVCWV